MGKRMKRQDVDKAFEKEVDRQNSVLQPIFVMSLWDMGLRKVAIQRRLAAVQEYILSIKPDDGESIFDTLERETGVVMTMDANKPYYEYRYLTRKHGRLLVADGPIYNFARRQQTKWVAAELIAAFCAGVHRYDKKFGQSSITEFVSLVNEYRADIGTDWQQSARLMEAKTGCTWEELFPYKFMEEAGDGFKNRDDEHKRTG